MPGPGDPNGLGVAGLSFQHTPDQAHGLVCFKLVVAHPDRPITAAHIHQGTFHEAGPIVVPLVSGAAADGPLHGCVVVAHDVMHAIHHHPLQYYVNVHTEAYPDGAVRGQLVTARRAPH